MLPHTVVVTKRMIHMCQSDTAPLSRVSKGWIAERRKQKKKKKKQWRWDEGEFLCNSRLACQPLFLFTINTLMPITPSFSRSQCCDSEPACCPGRVSDIVLELAPTCRNICCYTQGRSHSCALTRTHTHGENLIFYSHTNCPCTRVMIPYFWRVRMNEEGLLMGRYMSSYMHCCNPRRQ